MADDPLSPEQFQNLKKYFEGGYPGTCATTKQLLEGDGERVLYAVRGEADNENSSGWRFFQTESGSSESEIVTCELWEVMMVDSSVMELLDRPSVIGSAFYLDDDCEFAEE